MAIHGNVTDAWGFARNSLDFREPRLVKKEKPRSSTPLRSTVRELGCPLLSAVARTMAFGSTIMSLATAWSNQSPNWARGSAAMSIGSNVPSAYVTRRSATPSRPLDSEAVVILRFHHGSTGGAARC